MDKAAAQEVSTKVASEEAEAKAKAEATQAIKVPKIEPCEIL